MGRTATIIEKPFSKTLTWKNEKTEKIGKGKDKEIKVIRETGWYWYDKETKENHMVESPFSFLWLESLTSFTGYNEPKNKSIYSNEVLDLNTQQITVKMGDDLLKKGLYKDIKGDVIAAGGKFCSAVYALADLGDGDEIVRILMAGSAVGTWLDLISKKGKELRQSYVTYYDTNAKTKGSVDYEEPVFKFLPAKKEDLEKADTAYTEKLEPYIKDMLARLDKPTQKAETDDDTEVNDTLPFDADDEDELDDND